MQNEKDVIAGLQRGDPYAVADVFNRFYEALRTYGTRFTDSKQDIEDSISDTFEVLMKRRALFKSFENIKASLYVTFRNRLFNLLKSNNRRATIHKTFYDRTANQADEELNARIENFLSKLPDFLEALSPRERQVVELKMYEDLTDQQIADRLGISVNNVYTLKSSAIKVLKNMLDQEPGSGNDPITLFIQWLILLISINYS